MNKTQQRTVKVLSRLIKICKEDTDSAGYLSDELEIMLNGLRYDDFFGTEGQNDPRGDFRDHGEWSMACVSGVD